MRRLLHALLPLGHLFEEGDSFLASRSGAMAWVTPLRCDCGARDEMWRRVYQLRGLV